MIETLEYAGYYRNQQPFGEPMINKRDLYPIVRQPEDNDHQEFVKTMIPILHYNDDTHSTVEILEQYSTPVDDLSQTIDQFQAAGLFTPEPKVSDYEMRYLPSDSAASSP